MQQIILTIFSMMVSANIVLFGDFPYYRWTYDALLSGQYRYNERLSGRGVLYFTKKEKLDSTWVLYFTDRRAIQLINGGYLHNNLITYFSPYSLYWYFKLRGLIKKCAKTSSVNL
jgi:hypothetical protein